MKRDPNNCYCGEKDCVGFYLLHPIEIIQIPILKKTELEEDANTRFKLIDSPSSGEVFTLFKELHILRSD